MNEVKVIELIIQGGFAGFAAALLFLFAMALRHFFQQDKAENKEREGWMGLLKTTLATTLDNQNKKFSELAGDFTNSLSEVVSQMQQYQDNALEKLVQTVFDKMIPVMQSRDSKLSLIHENIKVIPAETLRLLAEPSDQSEAFKQAFIQALEPLFAGLNAQIETIPGVEDTRAVVRDEVSALQAKLVDQIAPILEQLQAMALALAALSPQPAPIHEPGDPAAKETNQLDEHAVDEIIAAVIPDTIVQIEAQEQTTNG